MTVHQVVGTTEIAHVNLTIAVRCQQLPAERSKIANIVILNGNKTMTNQQIRHLYQLVETLRKQIEIANNTFEAIKDIVDLEESKLEPEETPF